MATELAGTEVSPELTHERLARVVESVYGAMIIRTIRPEGSGMLHELLECLGAVNDPRESAEVEHRLIDVLTITVCAVTAVFAPTEGFYDPSC